MYIVKIKHDFKKDNLETVFNIIVKHVVIISSSSTYKAIIKN